jgi:ferredoxin-type protein NapH
MSEVTPGHGVHGHRKPGSHHARLHRWRKWVQGGFLLAWLDPFLLRAHSFCSPVFHCHSCPLATLACPIGILANMSAAHAVPLIALGTILTIGALFGSLICGWVCPFGFLQDLLGKIPTPRFELPRWAGWFRYVVLVGLVACVPYFFGEESPLFVCRLCPAGALEGAVPSVVRQAVAGEEIFWPGPVKIAVLVVFLLAALFTWRPWCTLFCPLGAIYGLMNRVSLVFIRFQPARCTDCDLCEKVCRYGGRTDRATSDLRCIRCLECVRCDALSVGTVSQLPVVDVGRPE